MNGAQMLQAYRMRAGTPYAGSEEDAYLEQMNRGTDQSREAIRDAGREDATHWREMGQMYGEIPERLLRSYQSGKRFRTEMDEADRRSAQFAEEQAMAPMRKAAIEQQMKNANLQQQKTEEELAQMQADSKFKNTPVTAGMIDERGEMVPGKTRVEAEWDDKQARMKAESDAQVAASKASTAATTSNVATAASKKKVDAAAAALANAATRAPKVLTDEMQARAIIGNGLTNEEFNAAFAQARGETIKQQVDVFDKTKGVGVPALAMGGGAPQAKAPVQERLMALKAEGDKRNVGFLADMAEAAEEMDLALKSGDSTISAYGDNAFTRARAKFNNALGRLESGSNMPASEVAAYNKMLPTFADDPGVRAAKIKDAKNKTRFRLSVYGFTPEEIREHQIQLAGGAPQGNTRMAQGLPGESEAMAGPEDPQVRKWADQYTKGNYKQAEAILAKRRQPAPQPTGGR